MNRVSYSILFIAVLVIDRIAKLVALRYWMDEHVITPFLSFQTSLNRGISWGLFHSAHTSIFAAITVLISVLTVALLWYTYQRYKNHYSIVGEVLVLSGSLSNIIDRLYYGGVVDFIVVHKGDLAWPVFNIADSAIVLGVCIMFIQQIWQSK